MIIIFVEFLLFTRYPVRGIDQSSSFNIIPSLMKSSTAGKGFFRIRTKSTTSVESSDSTSPTAALKGQNLHLAFLY